MAVESITEELVCELFTYLKAVYRAEVGEECPGSETVRLLIRCGGTVVPGGAEHWWKMRLGRYSGSGSAQEFGLLSGVVVSHERCLSSGAMVKCVLYQPTLMVTWGRTGDFEGRRLLCTGSAHRL